MDFIVSHLGERKIILEDSIYRVTFGMHQFQNNTIPMHICFCNNFLSSFLGSQVSKQQASETYLPAVKRSHFAASYKVYVTFMI